jgi:TonB family protein
VTGLHLGAVTALLLTQSCAAPDARPSSVRRGEHELWKAAQVVIMPEYPAESLAAGVQGVAVTSIRANRGGAIESVTVLESPDPAIGRSLSVALGRWRFTPISLLNSTEPLAFSGKLTFYFRIVGGRGQVLKGTDALPTEPAGTNGVHPVK